MSVKFVSIILISIFVFGYFSEALDNDSFKFSAQENEIKQSYEDSCYANSDQDDSEKTTCEGHGQFGFALTILSPEPCKLYFLAYHQSSSEYLFVMQDRHIPVLLRPPIS